MRAIDYIRKGWTQDTYARDKAGRSVKPGSYKAVKWCALGAISRAYSLKQQPEIIYRLCAAIGVNNISPWNDDEMRTKREVLAAFRKAGI